MYLRLTVTDVPGVWVDERHAAVGLDRVTRSYWYRLPAHWCPDGVLLGHRRGQLVDALYGPGRHQADAEGSRYLVLQVREELLSGERARARPWLADLAGCFVWTEPDRVRPAAPSEL